MLLRLLLFKQHWWNNANMCENNEMQHEQPNHGDLVGFVREIYDFFSSFTAFEGILCNNNNHNLYKYS